MFKSTLRRRAAQAGTAILTGSIALSVLVTAPADADPRQHTNQAVGVGSDTIQEVLNAFAGQADDDYYTPLASSGDTGRVQISSWDAVAPYDETSRPAENSETCIKPVSGLNAIQRPNGSSQGRDALSRAHDGGLYDADNPAGDPACVNKSTQGIVTFARSSSGPSGSTTQLTYIPLGRDALTYAFTYVDGAAGDAGDSTSLGLEDLTFSELQGIFTGGGSGSTVRAGTADEMLIVPCDIQHGSGTQKDWPGKVGGSVTTGSIDSAAARCDALGNVSTDTNGRLQESKPNQLEEKADLFESANPGVEAMLVVGHSVSNYVAQSNGASPNNLHADVTLGSAVAGQAPYTGTAPTLVPNPCFYNPQDGRDPSITTDDCPWVAGVPTGAVNPGRKVYIVLLTSLVSGLGNDGVKQLFIGGTSKMCQAEATIQKFGFTLLPQSAAAPEDRCGDTSKKGGLVDA